MTGEMASDANHCEIQYDQIAPEFADTLSSLSSFVIAILANLSTCWLPFIIAGGRFERCDIYLGGVEKEQRGMSDRGADMKQRQGHALQITRTTCVIKGNVTIDHFEEIKNALVDALLSSDEVLINIEEVKAIDIDGIMLLCAINRSAEIRGKRVELAGVVGKDLVSQVAAVGFPRIGCIHRMNHACFWDILGDASARTSGDICRDYERIIRCDLPPRNKD